jgi:hypothetical protein
VLGEIDKPPILDDEAVGILANPAKDPKGTQAAAQEFQEHFQSIKPKPRQIEVAVQRPRSTFAYKKYLSPLDPHHEALAPHKLDRRTVTCSVCGTE